MKNEVACPDDNQAEDNGCPIGRIEPENPPDKEPPSASSRYGASRKGLRYCVTRNNEKQVNATKPKPGYVRCRRPYIRERKTVKVKNGDGQGADTTKPIEERYPAGRSHLPFRARLAVLHFSADDRTARRTGKSSDRPATIQARREVVRSPKGTGRTFRRLASSASPRYSQKMSMAIRCLDPLLLGCPPTRARAPVRRS